MATDGNAKFLLCFNKVRTDFEYLHIDSPLKGSFFVYQTIPLLGMNLDEEYQNRYGYDYEPNDFKVVQWKMKFFKEKKEEYAAEIIDNLKKKLKGIKGVKSGKLTKYTTIFILY